MAWPALVVDRVTLDINQLRRKVSKKEGTYYRKQNTFIAIPISLAWFEGDNSETIWTLDRRIDRIGLLRNDKGRHDRKGSGSYTMALEARNSTYN